MPELRPFKAVRIFEDPTPKRVIMARIIRPVVEFSPKATTFTKQEGSAFLDRAFLVARKLASVYKHIDAYHKEEKRLVADLEAGADHHDYSQELYDAYDGFAVQVKSTLDHLTGALQPVFGKWNVYTYGDCGADVVKALENNIPREKYAGHVRFMKAICFTDAHRAWLEPVIGTRDRINHGMKGGVKISAFAVFKTSEGKVELPRWNDEQTLGAMMDAVWSHLIVLCEDFLMCAINFRLDDAFGMVKNPIPPTIPQSAWHLMAKDEALSVALGLKAKRL